VQSTQFLGLRSTYLSTDLTGGPFYQYAWAGTNATNTPVNGPDGFRRAARITLTSANGYISSYAATLSGDTAVPFRFGCQAKQATIGSELRLTTYFSGDPGGPETFTNFVSSDSVPAVWTKFSESVTPTRNAHTSVVLRIGCATNGNNIDVDEPWGVQNTTIDPPAIILVDGPAPASIAAQSITVTNDGSRLFASYGKVEAELQNLNTILGKHVAVWAESTQASPYLEMGLDGDDVYITIRDNSRNLVATVTASGVITTSAHDLTWIWDADAPVYGLNHIAIMVDGITVGAGRTSSWTPPADSALTPIGIGGGNSANELHGAFSRIQFLDPSTICRVAAYSLVEGDAVGARTRSGSTDGCSEVDVVETRGRVLSQVF